MNRKTFTRLLADEIRHCRMKAGKSQLEVLCETGINVGRIEMGNRSIELYTFIHLCCYFGCDSLEIVSSLERQFKKLTVR